MNPYVGLIFDIVLLCTFGATIYYALRLSRQFERMQADRKAFDALISALNLAAARAEAAIRTLKEAAAAGGESLQEKINAARALSDELEIIIQAGDNLAERLTGSAEKSRRAAAEARENKVSHEALPDDTPAPRSRAEKELLEALRAKQRK